MPTDLCIHELSPETCGLCHPRQPTPPACRWCGHPLTDPVSQYLGCGPVCFRQDKRAHARLLEKLRGETGWLRLGPVSHHTAVEWSNAIRQTDGLDAAIRTRGDGEYVYFTNDEGAR